MLPQVEDIGLYSFIRCPFGKIFWRTTKKVPEAHKNWKEKFS